MLFVCEKFNRLWACQVTIGDFKSTISIDFSRNNQTERSKKHKLKKKRSAKIKVPSLVYEIPTIRTSSCQARLQKKVDKQ